MHEDLPSYEDLPSCAKKQEGLKGTKDNERERRMIEGEVYQRIISSGIAQDFLCEPY
jgi:hypothetical protein